MSKAGRFLIVAALLLAAWPALANPDGVAVIVGNRNYQGGLPEVRYAHNDAEAIKRYVVDVLKFREGNVIDLRDASKARMEAVFGNSRSPKGRLFNWVREGRSDVFVFYSGHGAPGMSEGRAYLLPSDTDPDLIDINGYPVDVLYANLAAVPARSVSLYMDACFSGVSPGGPVIKGVSGLTVKPRLPKSPGDFAILGAAQADQVASWDDDAKHGLFTEYLLRALYGAADKSGNGDGQVTLGEARAYLDQEMTYAARRRHGREQKVAALGPVDRVIASWGPSGPPKRPAIVLEEKIAEEAEEEPDIPLAETSEVRAALKRSNVRAEPSVDSERIGLLAQGARVEVTGTLRRDGATWYRVMLAGGAEGYIFGPLLGRPLAETDADAVELAYWESVRSSKNPAELEAYIEAYPDGEFVELARIRAKSLKAKKKQKRVAKTAKRKRLPSPDSPQAMYEEYMGYAEDLHREAEWWEKKAEKARPAMRKAYRAIAHLKDEMSGEKEEMAKGFLLNDHERIREARERYGEYEEKLDKLMNGLAALKQSGLTRSTERQKWRPPPPRDNQRHAFPPQRQNRPLYRR